MHTSSFSYYVSRPYPFRWFTPVVVVGGIIAIVLFSLLNFASSGYNLVSEYSTDPNSTASQSSWFDKWSLNSKVRPTCLPSAIPLNTQLYTNNTALLYTLHTVQPIDSEVVSLPSLVYINNPLVNCSLQSIQMTLEMLERTANQMAEILWGLNIQGVMSCQVNGPTGAMSITLNTDYDFVPSTVSTYAGQYRFPGRNATRSASLWWGESLLSFLYLHLIDTFHEAIGDQNKMSLYLTRNQNVTNDLANQAYFNILERDMTIYPDPDIQSSDDHYQITKFSDPGSSGFNGLIYRTGWIRPENSTLPNLIANTSGPNIWPVVDTLAKSFESTILTDLGQVDARPNVLVDPGLLQNYTSNFTALYKDFLTNRAHMQAGPASADYDSLKDGMGPLAVNPATLATNYLCQIPKRKPTGDLILSVLVADLVFIQALWLILTFAVGQWMRHKDPGVDLCKGCAARLDQAQETPGQARYEKLSNVEVSGVETQEENEHR